MLMFTIEQINKALDELKVQFRPLDTDDELWNSFVEIAKLYLVERLTPDPPRVWTQEEKIAFRKEWDERYERGQKNDARV